MMSSSLGFSLREFMVWFLIEFGGLCEISKLCMRYGFDKHNVNLLGDAINEGLVIWNPSDTLGGGYQITEKGKEYLNHGHE